MKYIVRVYYEDHHYEGTTSVRVRLSTRGRDGTYYSIDRHLTAYHSAWQRQIILGDALAQLLHELPQMESIR